MENPHFQWEMHQFPIAMFVYRRVSLGGLNILNSVDTFDHIGFRATTFCEKIIGKQELNCCKASFRFRNFRNLIHSDSLDLFLFVGWDWQPQNPGSQWIQWVNYKFIFLKETLWINLHYPIGFPHMLRQGYPEILGKNPVDDHRKEPFLLVGNDLFSGRRSKVQRTGKNPCFKVISYNACMALSKIWQLLEEQMSFGMIIFPKWRANEQLGVEHQPVDFEFVCVCVVFFC